MARFQKAEGYLMVDHRASPGLTEAQARLCGYDPAHTKEGKVFEAATMTCSHCKCTVVKNPLRTRARNYCLSCSNHYICDGCAHLAAQPDYTHMPFDKLTDLTLSGKATPLFGTSQMGSPQKLILPASVEKTPAHP